MDKKECQIIDLGLSDYREALLAQKSIVEDRKADKREDALIITEHRPVFTVGRSGSLKNLLADSSSLKASGIDILRVDRGGDITFHGPGQLVAYPIIKLRDEERDIHKFLRRLENIAISFLGEFEIEVRRREGMTGVWVGESKVVSIGIGLSRWVTYHGLSINICPDMRHFSMIVPCGIEGCKTVSMQEILGQEIDMSYCKNLFAELFLKEFSYKVSCDGTNKTNHKGEIANERSRFARAG
ncbi:MAG: lipoyl(octanoyl) transferase LipB [Candidatus Omnitrophica bacterium]|nr:lipoyl(octanoyl) transferase LipB [Candidatus Omnitrophota bacterium]